MGIADEADRTLFVGNLDPNVTEELLFELFLQAGPLIKVKIPKDNDGKPKQFGFVNFKHEVSVPYGMNLLNGTQLFGRPLKIQFRSGSSHISQDVNSPGGSQNPSPSNTPTHRGGRYEQVGSPSYSPPQVLHRSFSSPDSLQRQALMNTWQQMNGGFLARFPQQGSKPYVQGGGSSPGYRGSWQQDSPSPRGHRQPYQHESGAHQSRDQRFSGESGSDRHHRSQRGEHYHHDDRSGGGGGRSRDYPERRRESSKEGRWKRY